MPEDVCIVGAGVVGCAVAAELARSGMRRIVVVDRARPGAGASGAAAGLLAVSSGRASGGALFELKRRALRGFPALAERLRAESGQEIGYVARGIVRLAFSEEEEARLRSLASRRAEQGFRVEQLEPADLRRFEPRLGPRARFGVWFAGEAQVDPRKLVAALRAEAEARGVVFRPGLEVTGARIAGDRILALSAGGQQLAAAEFVIAAGAGSAEVGRRIGVRIPVRPDRGEMLALRVDRPLRRPLAWDDAYLVPQGDEIWVGSTSARGVDEALVTGGGVAGLLQRALCMLPDLARAPLVRTWAGLRPCPSIRRPIIGPVPGYRNLVIATGHHRSGILLGPLTGSLVAQILTRGETEIDLAPFAYRRR